MGKLASGVVIILGVLILSGAVFSFDYGVNSFTPAIYDSGFSQFGGDAYTYIGNNAAAVAAHVNNLYKTTVKYSVDKKRADCKESSFIATYSDCHNPIDHHYHYCKVNGGCQDVRPYSLLF